MCILRWHSATDHVGGTLFYCLRTCCIELGTLCTHLPTSPSCIDWKRQVEFDELWLRCCVHNLFSTLAKNCSHIHHRQYPLVSVIFLLVSRHYILVIQFIWTRLPSTDILQLNRLKRFRFRRFRRFTDLKFCEKYRWYYFFVFKYQHRYADSSTSVVQGH